MWNPINQEHPNLWVWLGDNIYGDSDDMAVLKAKYDLQLQQEGYQKLRAQTPIIGTWDDHDYGRNDAGKMLRSIHENRLLVISLDHRSGSYRMHGLLREALVARVQEVIPNMRAVQSRFEPAAGAVLLALDLAHIKTNPILLERLEATLPGAAFFAT